ncbi:MAG: nucleotidyltransferase domain-containing protein [Acidimicrobiia bacterium]|nr:nucleotidyltransferase domain-containing protein [Acidimicrobiia bacterium]
MDLVRPVEALVPGVQGRLLGALTRVSGSMTLRALADVAGVSAPQASRVLRRLVDLGVVERRDVPPAALFSLASGNLTADVVRDLAAVRRLLLERLRAEAEGMSPRPVNVTVFGSLARGDAGPESDVDLLVVRPEGVDPDDDSWSRALGRYVDDARRSSGSNVELVEVAAGEVGALLRSRRRFWRELTRDGVHISGSPLGELGAGDA